MSQLPNGLKSRFMLIAVLNDEGKIAAQIEAMRSEYGAYMEIINVYLNLEPEQVIEQLKAAYPQTEAALNSPFAVKIVTRIQNHLKQKGNKENAD
jgi:hypothetical protein